MDLTYSLPFLKSRFVTTTRWLQCCRSRRSDCWAYTYYTPMERSVHKYHRPMAMARLLPYADRLDTVRHCDCFRRRSIQECRRSSLLPNGYHCLFVLCLACRNFCPYRAFILESPSKRIHGRWLVLVSVSPFSLNSLVVLCTLPLTSLSKSRLNSGMLTKASLVGHETKCERMREPDESSIIRLYA